MRTQDVHRPRVETDDPLLASVGRSLNPLSTDDTN